MKTKYYLTLDTETATLPFINEIAKTERDRKQLAIAKPLVYDIGWTVVDRNGTVYKRKNYLVQETFFVPQIFNTAYYREKRPLYMEMYKKKEIQSKCWNDIIEELLEDLRICDFCTAYNAAFDYKKAIPFTERYITALYSNRYQDWENNQKQRCKDLLFSDEKIKNETYLEPTFVLRNEEFNIVDLWGLACQRLINTDRYKDYCLKNKKLSPSGLYFSTNAESVFGYLTKNSDFIEQHTALDDAEIETQILLKLIKKGKIEPFMTAFPFRDLGYTYKYVTNDERKYKYIEILLDSLNLKNIVWENNVKSTLEKILENL